MAEFQTKKPVKKMWHSPLMLFVLLFVLLIFMYNMVGLVEKQQDSINKHKIALAEVESIQKREEEMNLIISKLNTEQGIEEALRDKYHLVKQGEKMVVIVNQEANATDAVTQNVPKNSFYNFFRNLFK
jgi:cell division protein FtsB